MPRKDIRPDYLAALAKIDKLLKDIQDLKQEHESVLKQKEATIKLQANRIEVLETENTLLKTANENLERTTKLQTQMVEEANKARYYAEGKADALMGVRNERNNPN